MQKDVEFCYADGILSAAIGCDIDHHSARALRERIDEMLFCMRPATLLIDFSRVEFMDSSGLGLILGRVEKAAAINADVRVSGLSDRQAKLVRLSGIERIRGLSLIK